MGVGSLLNSVGFLLVFFIRNAPFAVAVVLTPYPDQLVYHVLVKADPLPVVFIALAVEHVKEVSVQSRVVQVLVVADEMHAFVQVKSHYAGSLLLMTHKVFVVVQVIFFE